MGNQPASDKSTTFQKSMNQGHSAAWDQDWEQAARFYRQAVEEAPDNVQALTSLGLALYEMEQYDQAMQCYLKAASAAPSDPAPYEKMARIFEREGKLNDAIRSSLQAAELYLKNRDVERAIDNWLRVLSLKPEDLNVRSRLAAVLERVGRLDEASSEFLAVASIFQRNGDYSRAMQALDHAAKITPDNQEIRMAIQSVRNRQPLPRPSRPRGGTGPVRMAEVRSKVEASTAQIAANGADPVEEARRRALVDLAGILFDQAEEATAPIAGRGTRRGLDSIARGTDSLKISDSARTRIVLHLGQAIDSQTSDQPNQAIEELTKAVELGLQRSASFYNLGYLLARKNDARGARYLRESTRNEEYALASHLLLGGLAREAGNWPEAVEGYLRALSLADAEIVGGEAADEIRQLYEPLIEQQMHQTDENAQRALCDSIHAQLRQTGWREFIRGARAQLNGQIPVAELLLESRSGQVVEIMTRVRQLQTEGKYRTAMEEALYALQESPTYLPLHHAIGELLLASGRSQDAIHKFLIVARAYRFRGEASRAIRMLKRAIELAPMDLSIRGTLIDLLVENEQVDQGLEETVALGDLFYQLADLDNARQTYLNGLKLAQQARNNRDWGVKILHKVADIDMQRLNLRQALRIYEQIRTIRPDDEAVRAQLVSLNLRLDNTTAAMREVDGLTGALETAGKRSQGIDFLNGLLAEHPGNADLLIRQAALLARSGKAVQAVQTLDSAADQMAAENRLPEAARLLEAIVQINPPNAADYRNALAQLKKQINSGKTG